MGPPADDVHGIPVEAEVRQEGCTFAPHVVLLAPGGVIRFLNRDPIAHQIRIVGAAGTSVAAMQGVLTQDEYRAKVDWLIGTVK